MFLPNIFLEFTGIKYPPEISRHKLKLEVAGSLFVACL
jgi:hypothetical protein